jgi:hypothetical protein
VRQAGRRSTICHGTATEMVAVWIDGRWTDAPDLDEARQRDRVVPLGDGRWLLVNGFEVPEPFWEDETSSTVVLHADGTATEGPELPTDENGGGPAFPLPGLEEAHLRQVEALRSHDER